MSKILEELRIWRDTTARKEQKEPYRVLPNAALEALATLQPKTLAELQKIKGIKSVKSRQYGSALLALIQKNSPGDLDSSDLELTAPIQNASPSTAHDQTEPLSVSQFLDGLNLELSGMAARIRGEVTSLDIRERVVYFSLKDQQDGSVLSCLIFRYQYEVGGIHLALGDEVILEGVPDIYKPSGRLSFRAETIEYAGEGALKKAYDTLYKKLEQELIFAPEKKRPLPLYPERIALITSADGAALGDFTTNLCRAGFQVTLYPTLVEGKRAVFDILAAIQWFNDQADQFDVLVIIRGGGSLESLQAFNTESLVRAVATARLPVLAGIGHERDISLVALAADVMVSTPTATAKTLSQSWEAARQHHKQYLLFFQQHGTQLLQQLHKTLEQYEYFFRDQFQALSLSIQEREQSFREQISVIPERLKNQEEILVRMIPNWTHWLERIFRALAEQLQGYELRLQQYHPNRALRLGYSFVRRRGKIIRQAKDLTVGDSINIEFGSGTIEGEVKNISL